MIVCASPLDEDGGAGFRSRLRASSAPIADAGNTRVPSVRTNGGATTTASRACVDDLDPAARAEDDEDAPPVLNFGWRTEPASSCSPKIKSLTELHQLTVADAPPVPPPSPAPPVPCSPPASGTPCALALPLPLPTLSSLKSGSER